MSQAKEDVAVAYVTWPIPCQSTAYRKHAKFKSARATKKRSSCVKLVLHSLIIGIAVEKALLKTKKSNAFTCSNSNLKKITVINSVFEHHRTFYPVL